jgi:hypothetical protein
MMPAISVPNRKLDVAVSTKRERRIVTAGSNAIAVAPTVRAANASYAYG